eukprot:12732971-Alexandrium_andersonii.AAC.1
MAWAPKGESRRRGREPVQSAPLHGIGPRRAPAVRGPRRPHRSARARSRPRRAPAARGRRRPHRGARA